MSAPRTNIEKQSRWHRGPLVGMALVIVFVGVMFMWLTGAFGPDEPDAPVTTEQGGAPTAEGIAPDTTVAPATNDGTIAPAANDAPAANEGAAAPDATVAPVAPATPTAPANN